MENNNALAQKFTAKSLLLYAIPTVITMIFMSTYTIVDSIFIAKYVGEDALAAVNIVFPAFIFAVSLALVLATGATAIIGKLMGEGKGYEAKRFFTTIYIIGIFIGVIATVIIVTFIDPIITALGANEVLLPLSKDYLFPYAFFATSTVLQIFTQAFFITAGKPTLGFLVCVSGGIVNMMLDYLLIAPNIGNMGIAGAALATGIGATVPALFGLVYFAFVRSGTLHFVKPSGDIRQIFQSLYNGMSEFFGSISTAIVMILFNLVMMSLVGEGGVAAISAILTVQGILSATFNGFSIGVQPVMSFKYGEQNHAQLKKVVHTSLKFIFAISIAIIAICLIFAEPMISLFIDRSSDTFAMAVQGLQLFSISYLFAGANVFISALFTSLSNGKVSAILATMRTLVFTVAALLIVPTICAQFTDPLIGVWLAVPIAEGFAILLSIWYYKRHKNTYQY